MTTAQHVTRVAGRFADLPRSSVAPGRIGIRAMLPLERAWTGTPFGGQTQHRTRRVSPPAQGYRHIQMGAAVTVSGGLTGMVPVSP